MRGEDDGRLRMIGMYRVHIEAIALDGHLFGLIANAAEFAVKIISNSSFVSRDRLDINELPCKRDSVHAEENSKSGFRLRALTVGPLSLALRPQPLAPSASQARLRIQTFARTPMCPEVEGLRSEVRGRFLCNLNR